MSRGKGAELVYPAFAAAEDHDHGEVGLGARPASADRFDDQDSARRIDCLDTARQDLVCVAERHRHP